MGRDASSSLVVTFNGWTTHLRPPETLVFGRDPACGLQIGSGDRGISRIAGELQYKARHWFLSNVSTTRALHVVDETGYAVPMPIMAPHYGMSSRLIVAPGITVLLTGEITSYALRVETTQYAGSRQAVLAPTDGRTTFRQPILTPRRKEALVAVLAGYLVPFPRYDPRPLSYAEAGELARLPASTIRKRMEDVRCALVEVGVGGLVAHDAPWRLAEWVLATRMVVPADLEWLRQRRGDARSLLAG